MPLPADHLGAVRASLAFSENNELSVAVSDSSCDSVESVIANTGSSSLSVTVLVSDGCTGLSEGAIAGIAFGAVVGGILIAVAIFVLIRYLVRRKTNKMNSYLHAKEMTDLNV